MVVFFLIDEDETKLQHIQTRLTDEQLIEFMEVLKANGYTNRAAGLRDAVELFIKLKRNDNTLPKMIVRRKEDYKVKEMRMRRELEDERDYIQSLERLEKNKDTLQTEHEEKKEGVLETLRELIPYFMTRIDLTLHENKVWFSARGKDLAQQCGLTVKELRNEFNHINAAIINHQLEVIPENGGKTCQFKILDPNWRAGVGT